VWIHAGNPKPRLFAREAICARLAPRAAQTRLTATGAGGDRACVAPPGREALAAPGREALAAPGREACARGKRRPREAPAGAHPQEYSQAHQR
jgi:hypothetical protein